MRTLVTRMTLCIALICGLTLFANGQNLVVTGKVTDEKNKLLTGVKITIKGTKQNTKTNNKGEYIIATQKGKIVMFSLKGYTSKSIVVTNAKHDVVLKKTIKFTPPIIVDAAEISDKNEMKVSEEHYYKANKCYDRKEVAACKMPSPPPPVRSTIQYTPPVVADYQKEEEYSPYTENRFTSVMQQPLSTFSLDVDAASYSNIRRMINQGQLPPKDAVRTEELINYFSYDYPQPKGEHPVSITTETAICPWNTNHGLFKIGVKAKDISSEKLPASNFVFLIDVSGSMEGANRLGLVKSSLKLLSNNLREKDRVAIVVYAGAAGEVLPSTEGSDRQKIIDVIDKLNAGGSTAGGAGIQLAYKIAEKNFISNGNNRVILCTDGDFNVGVSSTSELESLIESKRKTGIFLTVLGYGMGNYKDNKLQTLAQKGNGNHAYIDNLQEANKVLVNEFGSTMYTVAKDVKIQVEFNPEYISSYRLVGYESRLLNKEDFNDDTKDAGELGAGHTVTALYELIPVGVENNYGGVDKLKYQEEKIDERKPAKKNSPEALTVKLRYKKPNEDNSTRMEVPVLFTSVLKTPSNDFKFAMAVAMFGQLLKDSYYKGISTYQNVIKLANEGIGEDKHGYRREFVRLVESVNQLTK